MMKVSSRVHYGLRAMTELAKAYGSVPVPLSEIARNESLPLAYLEQLVSDLRRAGYPLDDESVGHPQGCGGGIGVCLPPFLREITNGAEVVAGHEEVGRRSAGEGGMPKAH